MAKRGSAPPINEGAVLVIDFEWILLFHVQAQLPEPMGQRVLIDLFQVAVLVVAVNLENAVEPTQGRKGAKTQVIRLWAPPPTG